MTCSSREGKARARNKLIGEAKEQVRQERLRLIQHKDFLTAKEAAVLLNCSVRSIYYYIEKGELKAHNIGQRLTRLRRADIDKLFR